MVVGELAMATVAAAAAAATAAGRSRGRSRRCSHCHRRLLQFALAYYSETRLPMGGQANRRQERAETCLASSDTFVTDAEPN